MYVVRSRWFDTVSTFIRSSGVRLLRSAAQEAARLAHVLRENRLGSAHDGGSVRSVAKAICQGGGACLLCTTLRTMLSAGWPPNFFVFHSQVSMFARVPTEGQFSSMYLRPQQLPHFFFSVEQDHLKQSPHCAKITVDVGLHPALVCITPPSPSHAYRGLSSPSIHQL